MKTVDTNYFSIENINENQLRKLDDLFDPIEEKDIYYYRLSLIEFLKRELYASDYFCKCDRDARSNFIDHIQDLEYTLLCLENLKEAFKEK